MAGSRKGKGGRKPLPRETKVLHGTFRGDREPENIPRPKGDADCPPWLDAEAKREWERLAPELRRLNLLTSVDRSALAVYCQAWADFKWAIDTLRIRKKRVVKSPSGYKQIHPVMTIRRQSAELMLKAAAEFGMTPSARSRIDAILPKTPPGDTPGATGTDGKQPVTDRLGRPI